ncbi:MAG: paraquat-inducible membrane protein A, partial [Proteobacteria bacterium]
MNSPPTARQLNLCLCHTCGQPCDMHSEPTE